jgi:hypothetical protein
MADTLRGRASFGAVKEIDDFLPRFVTPTLSPLGYRKSGHTYRRQFASGDWGIISFRAYPVDIRGSFHVDASFVPGPLFDWFCFRSPDLASKEPTGWWMDWGAPVGTALGNDWRYESDDERDVCASLLIERLTAVTASFDQLGNDADLLLRAALGDTEGEASELPSVSRHLRHPTWKAALLIRRGRSPELEAALAEADAYPALRLREWADRYLAAENA